MDELQSLAQGFLVALTWKNLALMFVGVVLGVIIGVLPGLGGANGVAILLPLTFTMAQAQGGTTSAIILLSCIYWGALFGGAITWILFNIPGEPWSVATTFDGYPLAQQGRAGNALAAAFTSSFVGALVAVILITFLSPMVAKFALEFGAPEFFAVYLLTFCAFIGMSKEPPFKTLAAMMLGFTLAAVGTDPVTGALRLTFGSTHMLAGFDFLIAVIVWTGIYVASTLFIAFFMRWLGKYTWWKVVAVSVGTSVVFFLIFETWFKVPLPKGPLEAALGLL
jgi:putative tricarboxylic transport membrane protein